MGIPVVPAASIRDLPPAAYRAYRRFYSRQPFGPARADLQAWLIARNVGEMLGGRLRSPDRAMWGHKKKLRRRKDVAPETDAQTMEQFAKAMGIPHTPGGA